MQIPPYMRALGHALSVTVIGCGGTGSVLLQQLARINKAMISKGSMGIVVTCIDDDIVTDANLGRQLFTEADLGRAKASVMIERCNRFYGTNWFALPRKFDMDCLRTPCLPGNIVITCVDNIKTRRLVSNYLGRSSIKDMHETLRNLFWIDTGNGKDFGQVILSSKSLGIPDVFELHPGLRESKKSNLPSCSLAEALDRQSLFINSDVASIAAKLVWDLTQEAELKWKGAYINQNKSTPIRKIPA